MTARTRTMAACMASVEAEIATNPVAASLRHSAQLFRDRGEHFSADFTDAMADDADAWPALYRHWAAQQAERASRT